MNEEELQEIVERAREVAKQAAAKAASESMAKINDEKALSKLIPEIKKVLGPDLSYEQVAHRPSFQLEKRVNSMDYRGREHKQYISPPLLDDPEVGTLASPSGTEVLHEWRVYPSGPGTEPGETKWAYIGGTVWTSQGDPIVVPNGFVDGTVGFVCLKITRDSSSREITAAEVVFVGDVTDADYGEQLRPLARVSNAPGDPPVVRLQFQEIRLQEDLVVFDGELKLGVYDLAHRNVYDLPL